MKEEVEETTGNDARTIVAFVHFFIIVIGKFFVELVWHHSVRNFLLLFPMIPAYLRYWDYDKAWEKASRSFKIPMSEELTAEELKM